MTYSRRPAFPVTKPLLCLQSSGEGGLLEAQEDLVVSVWGTATAFGWWRGRGRREDRRAAALDWPLALSQTPEEVRHTLSHLALPAASWLGMIICR